MIKILNENDIKQFISLKSNENGLYLIGDRILFILSKLIELGYTEDEFLWNKAADLYEVPRPYEINTRCAQCGSIAFNSFYKEWKNGKNISELISDFKKNKMTEKKLIHSFDHVIYLKIPEQEKQRNGRELLKKLNNHHGWPGWNSLKPNDGSPEPSKKLEDAHWRLNATSQIKVKVNVYSDGSVSIET